MQFLTRKEEINKIIERISLEYSFLSNECKEDLLTFTSISSVEKSTLIVKEKQNADKLYFIVKGCFRVYYLKDGRDITDWFTLRINLSLQSIVFFNLFPVHVILKRLNQPHILSFQEMMFLV